MTAIWPSDARMTVLLVCASLLHTWMNMTTVLAPETEARQALMTALETEFKTEGFPVRGDKLHGSLGSEGTVIGVSPLQSSPWNRDNDVVEVEVLVQFYGKYELKVEPTQAVDPTIIESYAERFRRMVRTADPKTAGAWFFKLAKLKYPPDPTGNISRFEATLISYGSNSALIETS
jgi:hypothetical protein